MQRIRRNMTLNEDTDVKLTDCCKITGRTRGRFLDFIVASAHRALKSGQKFCVDGEHCKVGVVALNDQAFR